MALIKSSRVYQSWGFSSNSLTPDYNPLNQSPGTSHRFLKSRPDSNTWHVPSAYGRAWFLVLPGPLSILCSSVGGTPHYKLYRHFSFMSTAQDYVGFFGSHLTVLTHSELAVKTQSVFTTCASIQLHSFPSMIGTVGDLRSQSAGAVCLVPFGSLLYLPGKETRWSAVSPETPWILAICLSFPPRLVWVLASSLP